jgi:hypothetical protein
MQQVCIDKHTRDLRAALTSLSDQSLKTSRRLDDTYYSILEKVSVLRQTIGSLQELSGLTKELHENFESDTKELVDDIQGQFDTFDNFDSQQQQVVDLEDRIRVGKEKADSLTDRLAKAKERVDVRAQAELAWETKNTRMVPICAVIYGPYTDAAFCRSHSDLLGDTWFCPSTRLRLVPLPPVQTSQRCTAFQTYARLCIESTNYGSTYTGHSKRGYHRTHCGHV